jgi:hypothetical protein
MPIFTGQLNLNQVIPALYNMIISQRVFTKNLGRSFSALFDRAKVDGTMLGDTKLYVSTDILKTYEWTGDSEAQNLLKLYRPPQPKTQAITVNKFRFIATTVDYYLTKQAWMSETAFSEFTQTQLAWLEDTKYVYDTFTFNSFIGTTATTLNQQSLQISLPVEPDEGGNVEVEAYNRMVALTIGEYMANLFVDLRNPSRKYNDFGFMRSRDMDDLVVVWNAAWINQIKYIDLPTIFHNDRLIEKFNDEMLPASYFGNVNVSAGTTGATNITVRALIEMDFNTVEPSDPLYDKSKHVFPGELLPGNTPYEGGTTYGEDPSIIFKIMHRDSVPYMSGFQTTTEFFNQAALNNTYRLIWGHNTLEYLKEYPFITAKAVQAAG